MIKWLIKKLIVPVLREDLQQDALSAIKVEGDLVRNIIREEYEKERDFLVDYIQNNLSDRWIEKRTARLFNYYNIEMKAEIARNFIQLEEVNFPLAGHVVRNFDNFHCKDYMSFPMNPIVRKKDLNKAISALKESLLPKT